MEAIDILEKANTDVRHKDDKKEEVTTDFGKFIDMINPFKCGK